MENKDQHIYAKLILESLNKIESYLLNIDKKSFGTDSKSQSAVIMQLQVIGELAKKVPEDIKSKIDLPWKKIVGLRDMISHDYFSLDLDAIWNTTQNDLKEMEQKIKSYLETL